MNRFVLAFPIPVAPADVFPLTETVSVAADAKTLLVPGCAVNLPRARLPPSIRTSPCCSCSERSKARTTSRW